jgi:hypothetical protein
MMCAGVEVRFTHGWLAGRSRHGSYMLPTVREIKIAVVSNPQLHLPT